MRPGRERWPELLREAAEALGDEAALRLVGALGGRKVYVSPKAGPAELDAAGADVAAWLRAVYAGEQVTVPTFAARLADERRAYVLRHPHLTANDIATRLGMTSRRVEQIRAEARADPRQLLLF